MLILHGGSCVLLCSMNTSFNVKHNTKNMGFQSVDYITIDPSKQHSFLSDYVLSVCGFCSLSKHTHMATHVPPHHDGVLQEICASLQKWHSIALCNTTASPCTDYSTHTKTHKHRLRKREQAFIYQDLIIGCHLTHPALVAVTPPQRCTCLGLLTDAAPQL